MRLPILATLAIAVLAADLTAQRRGRFNRGPRTRPAPPPAEQVEPEKSKKPEKHLAIVGGDVYLGTGQRITGATVLIGDDKIVAVGHNLELPEGTEKIDASGKTVSPGFVCVYGSGMGAGRSSPFVDSVNPFDPQIKQGLAAGITSFLTGAPRGGSSISGSSAVIKLAYGSIEGMVLAENTVYGLNAQLSLSDQQKLTKLVEATKEYQQELEEFTAKKASDPQAKPPKAPRGSDNLLRVLTGKAQLWMQLGGGGRNPFFGGGPSMTSDLTAIRDALQISELLGTGVVLNKPTSAWLCPDEIAATGSMAILNPRNLVTPDPRNPDRTGSNMASAAILAEAGVPVAVTCPGGRFGGSGVGTGGIMGQDLNTPHVDAAFAVRGGLDNRKALRTLTLDAARILGVGDRIGSLEAGKDADLLILDGDPLHYRTFVETAIVNGKVVYEKDQEPLYSHIRR